jgi:hypothetical protein
VVASVLTNPKFVDAQPSRNTNRKPVVATAQQGKKGTTSRRYEKDEKEEKEEDANVASKQSFVTSKQSCQCSPQIDTRVKLRAPVIRSIEPATTLHRTHNSTPPLHAISLYNQLFLWSWGGTDDASTLSTQKCSTRTQKSQNHSLLPT